MTFYKDLDQNLHRHTISWILDLSYTAQGCNCGCLSCEWCWLWNEWRNLPVRVWWLRFVQCPKQCSSGHERPEPDSHGSSQSHSRTSIGLLATSGHLSLPSRLLQESGSLSQYALGSWGPERVSESDRAREKEKNSNKLGDTAAML